MILKLKLKNILFSNWLLCSVITLIILAGMLFEFYPMQFVENKAYDYMSLIRHREDNSPVVVINIDDESIASIGNWPWPRSYIADTIKRLSESKPKVLGLHYLYSGKEINPGIEEVKSIRRAMRTDPALKKTKNRHIIDKMLVKSETALNHDSRLIEAVNQAVNMILPIRFTIGKRIGNAGFEIPSWLLNHSMDTNVNGSNPGTNESDGIKFNPAARSHAVYAGKMISTYGSLARKAGAIGHINLIADRDGTMRKVPLLINYQNRFYPAFALQVAAKYLGGGLEDVKPGETGLNLQNLKIPTDGSYQMLVDYNNLGEGIKRYSFSDVFHGKVHADTIRDKIVLIGVTATGRAPVYRSTIHTDVSGVMITASVIENILNRKHFSRPPWAYVLEILVILYFGLFLVFVIPRINPHDGAFILGVFLVAWIGFAVVLFMVFGYWLKIFALVLIAGIGFTISGFKRFAAEKRSESMELNKILGQSLQEKGMLDMAYEKYLNCPVENPSVRDMLYNLGQDFERKRLFNKALSVYTHIQKAGRFKDIKQRIEALTSLGDTVIFSGRTAKQESTLLLDSATTKPTLGRYEVLKELGQGAMGTVYLGQDPKINREVAIKTLKYGDIDQNKLSEVKKRFFREAEAAGKLSHPKIVTIFDVGEDYDMAYMAMELLIGKDLSEFAQMGKLLPVRRVLKIIISVAEALEYAHKNGVVHRDIKPDNIIILANEQVKVADFGIARVMSASKTQTGVILGTPNYMSPEQVAGEKVDGRSDLFSLGVLLYELLTAEKPFKGDNLTHLMYSISNVSYVPLLKAKPNIQPCCDLIVRKLLTRTAKKRMSSAAQLIRHVKRCMKEL